MLGDRATFFLARLLVPILLLEETSADRAVLGRGTFAALAASLAGARRSG